MLQRLNATRCARPSGTQLKKFPLKKFCSLPFRVQAAAVTGATKIVIVTVLELKETNMIIGKFEYDRKADTYTGFVKTLSLRHSLVILRPCEKSGEKGPDYRAVFDAEEYGAEVGAAWKRTSENGQEFLSVSIDDPSFDRPINGALFLDDDGEIATLAWNRPKALDKTKPKRHPEKAR